MNRRRFLRNATGWALAGGIFVPRLIRANAFEHNVSEYLGAQAAGNVPVYNPYPPSGWWLMKGNGNDSSGNGASLTITGTQTYVTGENSVANAALTVGAVGGTGGTYASVAASACNGWSSFSCSLWFYQTGVGQGASRFFEKGGNNEITFGSYATNAATGFFSTLGSAGTFNGTFGVNVGIWYHYVFLGTAGATQAVYQNGAQVVSPYAAGTPAVTTGSIFFATYGGSPGSFTTPGYIQDVRFWKNEVLTGTQITNLYNAGAQSSIYT